jgi:hypothetical protein
MSPERAWVLWVIIIHSKLSERIIGTPNTGDKKTATAQQGI